MSRFIASAAVAAIACMAALDAGLPFYRHLPIGDASDFMVMAFLATWYGLGSVAAAIRTGGSSNG